MSRTDCDDLRDLMAGLMEALDPAVHPTAHSAIALALDALVDPKTPPDPWRAAPVQDVGHALVDARARVAAALEEERPPAEAMALAEAGRQLQRAARNYAGLDEPSSTT